MNIRVIILAVCVLCTTSTYVQAQEAAKLLQDGQTALDDGVYSLAQKQFEQYLSTYGKTIKPKEYETALLCLLRSLHEQKKLDDMQHVLASVDKIRLHDAGMLIFWHALIMYERGKYSDAIRSIDQFEKKYEKSEFIGRVERLRAWCYIKIGSIEEALVAFEAFDKSFGGTADSPDNLLEWAKALMCANREEKAAEVLNRLVRMPKELGAVREGHLWIGRLYLKRSNYKQAVTFLSILADDENARGDLRAEALYTAADAYTFLTNMETAVSSVIKGIELAQSPEVKSAGRLELGRVYLKGNAVDKGVSLLKAYISEYPADASSSEAQLEVANALLDEKKYDLAVNEFQYYIETFTNSMGLANAYYGRGWALTNIGRHSEAVTEFMKSYDLFNDEENKVRSLFKAGDAHFLNGQYQLASDVYAKLVSEYPETTLVPEASFQFAESRARAEMYDDAEKSFRDLVADYPSSKLAEEALVRLAEIKESQGLLRDAVALYSNLMILHPASKYFPDALFGRGKIYFQQWRFNKALEDFERIVVNYPESEVLEEAYYKRGMCHYWLGQDDTTLTVYNEFIKRYPDSNLAPSVFFWIGRYFFNHGQFKEAEKSFSDFASKYKDHDLADDALLWKGYSLIRRREYVAAIETFAAIAKDYPESPKMAEARFAQGEALCEIANYDAAILIFGEIITKYPESSLVISAWIRKGDCQFILGGDDQVRYEEGMSSYRVVINNSNAQEDQIIEAEYKSARCLEKLGRITEAFEYYYQKILLRLIGEREKGVWHNESSKLWMTKAALAAAGIAEDKEDYKAAVSILEIMLQIGGAGVPDAKSRIDKIKAEHWWLFY